MIGLYKMIAMGIACSIRHTKSRLTPESCALIVKIRSHFAIPVLAEGFDGLNLSNALTGWSNLGVYRDPYYGSSAAKDSANPSYWLPSSVSNVCWFHFDKSSGYLIKICVPPLPAHGKYVISRRTKHEVAWILHSAITYWAACAFSGLPNKIVKW